MEFVEEEGYIKGINIFRNKRALNTIEVAHIYQSIESHTREMNLLTGFTQVAKDSEVQDCFIKGKELSKKVISTFSELLNKNDIQMPSA